MHTSRQTVVARKSAQVQNRSIRSTRISTTRSHANVPIPQDHECQPPRQRKVRYLHVSAPIITVPHPFLKDKVIPVLSTKQYFPNEFPAIHRGIALKKGRNKSKMLNRRADVLGRVKTRAAR